MTNSCALDPYIAMCLVQLALEADSSKNWIPTKRGAPYPPNAMGHTTFLVCISVCGAMDKQWFAFCDWKKKMQFYIWQGTVFTSHLCKLFQKLIEKQDNREHPKSQFTARRNSFNDTFFAKNNSIKILTKKLVRVESQKSWLSQCIKISHH